MPTKVVYTDEYLIQRLKTFAKQQGFTPSKNDIVKDKSMPSPFCYSKRFGNWTNALKAAGLSVQFIKRRLAKSWPDSEIEQWLKDFYREHKRSPTSKDLLMNTGAPHPETIRKRYGGLNAALKKIKLPYNDPINIKGLDLGTYLKNRLSSRRLSREQRFLLRLLKDMGKFLDL